MGEASHNEKRPTCLEGSLRYPLDLTALDESGQVCRTQIFGPLIWGRP